MSHDDPPSYSSSKSASAGHCIRNESDLHQLPITRIGDASKLRGFEHRSPFRQTARQLVFARIIWAHTWYNLTCSQSCCTLMSGLASLTMPLGARRPTADNLLEASVSRSQVWGPRDTTKILSSWPFVANGAYIRVLHTSTIKRSNEAGSTVLKLFESGSRLPAHLWCQSLC